MPRRTPVGSIQRPSYSTGIEDPYPIFFIQCINIICHMANELWYHGSYGLSRDVHPTARVEIPTGADSEFITEYLTNDGRYIRIICQYSVNRSVQVTGIPEVWGSAS